MRDSFWTRLTLVAPTQAMIWGILVLPAIYLVWLSFHASSFGTGARYVGWENYAKILSDSYFWRALGNTAIVVLVVVHVELLIGLGMALLFAAGLPFRRLLIAVVLAPYAVSEVAAVVMWRFLFDPDVGHVAYLLNALGLPSLEWAVTPAHGLILVSLLSVWLHLPFTFMILYAARLALPGEVYEAAKIDGASPWQTFRRVTLPLLVPAMLMAMLFRLIFAFRLFSEVWLLTGGGPARSTEVVAVYLYLEAFRYNAFGSAAATGWLMVVASLLMAAPYLWRLAKAQGGDAR
ncbi:sugar ABC transporter permease [Roseomonas sp. OT10]|uniref:carbohydrate ABC transporter permease n=1 Tax=Roseomonas cutis TaxID=2897332 RepID=UPI001E53FA00|nr:sugar ABC transporter permease [Roseomonas sp. OT10]UFN50963.1 sugar ABC transporter permease [Roseomonas sp. OT10]